MPRPPILLMLLALLMQTLLPFGAGAQAAMTISTDHVVMHDCAHAHAQLNDAAAQSQHSHTAASATHAACCAHGHCDCATACSASALPMAGTTTDWLRNDAHERRPLQVLASAARGPSLLRPPISSLS